MAEAIGKWFLSALYTVLNALIAAVGGLLTWVLNLLPQMPEVPEPPAIVADANWLVPVPAIVGIAMTWVAIYVLFLAVKVAMKWVKAL